MRPALALVAATASLAAASPPASSPPSSPPPTSPPTSPPAPASGAAESGEAESAVAPAARPRAPSPVEPFAPALSGEPVIARPAGWAVIGRTEAWDGLVQATPGTRQAARWNYARSLIGQGLAAEALGVIEVMRQDEPDIVLAASYQLALGATLTLLHRPATAVTALTIDALATNPEACAWRMRALAEANLPSEALAEVHCAVPALNARRAANRAPFLLPVAGSAMALGQYAFARELVKTLPANHPQAELIRGRVELALGDIPQGKLRLARVSRNASVAVKLESQLSVLESDVTRGSPPRDATAQLRRIGFVWRGDDIERRALQLSYRLARQRHDLLGTLESGAALFRYFDGGPDRAALVAQLQEVIAGALAPGNPMPLDQVAGLYWDYRDLSPAGADGDLLVANFAERLQAAGLYDRAAELLEHQLLVRTRDIAQGPLSARVASLFILAGKPNRALEAIRLTETNAYPAAMLWDRHRVEAVALDQLGRTNEAMAVLQDVPDGLAIRGELYWKRRDWKGLAAVTEPTLTGSEPMTEVMQAKVLRYAIALAMLGREGELARLHDRYAAAFGKLPTAATFTALTAAVGAIDPAAVSAAMAAIPSASPAGDIADLVDAAPPPGRPVG